jgi:SAM-dependent methyltransferase
MTRWLAMRAEHLVALEPETIMCQELKTQNLANATIECATLEAYASIGPRFDNVVMINVLEHMQDDLEAMKLAWHLLRPGGRVCVLVPAHQALFGSLDERYGHIRRYARAEIAARMQDAGFQLEEASYFNPIGALGWFIVARVARRPSLDTTSVWLSEHFVVPLGRLLERLGHPPFGQSVVARGRRPQ